MGKTTTVTETTLIQPELNPGFSASSAGCAGACLVVSGLLCVIFQISATAIGASMGDVAAGIWAGVFFMITGGIGLSTSNQSTCSIVTYGLFSFVSFLCSIAVLVLASLGINDDRGAVSQYCTWSCEEDFDCRWDSQCHQAETKVAMNSMLVLFALVNVFATLYAQVVCCQGICCCAPSYNTVVERQYGTSSVPVAVEREYRQQPQQPVYQPSGAGGQVVVLVPSQDNPGQYVAVPYTGQPGQGPPVYGTTPPPGYSYDQPAVVSTQDA